MEIGGHQHASAAAAVIRSVLGLPCAGRPGSHEGEAACLVARADHSDARKTGSVDRLSGPDGVKMRSVDHKSRRVDRNTRRDGCLSEFSGHHVRAVGCLLTEVGGFFAFSTLRAGLSTLRSGFVGQTGPEGGVSSPSGRLSSAAAPKPDAQVRRNGRVAALRRQHALRRQLRLPTLRLLSRIPAVRRGRPAPRIAGSHIKVPPPGHRSTVFG